MLPVLLNLKFLKIYTFGIFLLLAFFWGSFILWKNIRLTSFKEEDVFDGLFLSIGGGLFAGRLIYVLMHYSEFGMNFLKFILINGYPGISIIGTIFGAFLTLYFFVSSKKIDFREIADYFVTPLLTAIVFGKFGSFFSGSEVGTKTNFFLKIKYAGYEGFRHLTSFYEALLFLVAAIISYKLLFEIRKEKLKKGFLLTFFLWSFSLIYFVFDKIKESTLYLQGYSFNRLLSLAVLLTTSVYFIYYFKSYIFDFLKKYGHKIFGKIHLRPKRKTDSGEEKKPPSN